MSRPRFELLPFGSKLSWVTGLVVAGDDDTGHFQAFGSAFLTGPGMAMTARHVVDAVFLHFTGKLPDEQKGQVSFGLELGTSDSVTGALVRWSVVAYHYSRAIDITGLVVEVNGLPLGVEVYPRLNVLPPQIDQEVFAYGYANTTWSFDATGATKMRLDPHVATGVVKEIHYEYRDRFSLPFPCLHTNARFDPGMSGGPVFNTEGQIFGVVCSNISPSNPNDEHVSYVSLVWPALGLRLGSPRPRVSANSAFIRDEAVAGRLQVLNLDWMSVDPGTPADRLHFGRSRSSPNNT